MIVLGFDTSTSASAVALRLADGRTGGEAAWAGRIDILAPADLLSLINHFRGSQVRTPPEPAGLAVAGNRKSPVLS